MPKVGIEPTIPCEKRILSPPRIPFRHLGQRNKKARDGPIVKAVAVKGRCRRSVVPRPGPAGENVPASTATAPAAPA